ncbi:MAG: valine--tRNA ligase, partial [Alphaproteobacteria bacterium]|nr:valine--tRNA ligase [Alphaproteobacteria bacterium]
YPMGFDDNGLPTERLVEKIKGKKAAQYESREAFVADCREIVEGAIAEFRALFSSVALSVDWRREYHTISDAVMRLSQASFLDLLREGEAYRDFRPTYWDWVDQTAIAAAEIENREMSGVMHEICFTLEETAPEGAQRRLASDAGAARAAPGGEGAERNHIIIATTRPELLGACVAVMYHPEDPNAEKYKGKTAVTPLFGVRVPMIADELVERDKGTGLVMCCTFGDDTDKEWWRKHELPLRAILGSDGKLNMECHTPLTAGAGAADALRQLHGLKLKPAREKTVELLQAEGALRKQTPITHSVKCAERSGTPIEIIPTRQWYIRTMDKKEALLERGRQCAWHPEYMRVRLEQWTESLKEDWCISRQRFFGVPFPVWYSKRAGEEGKPIYASPDQLPIDPAVGLPEGYAREEVMADSDVMDTWATSSLTPQINAGSLEPGKLFPADLRPQAHEIIRSWAFYTIVKAHLHANTVPWKHLMISGWCLAADKTKMSKSKGNVVTPAALIQEKGADAVRYWASTSRLGQDTAFSEELLKIGRKLTTKLWNASNFVSLQLEKLKERPGSAAQEVRGGIISKPLDVWILSRLHGAAARATAEFERFEYCDARVAVEDFFWNDFCDNYLELVKLRAYEGDASALHTLFHCLHAVLRLFAPFVPHVTEEIFSHLFAGHGSIHARGMWPEAGDYPHDAEAEQAGAAAVEALNAARKAKSEAGVSIKWPVAELRLPREMKSRMASLAEDLKAAANVQGEIAEGELRVTLAAEGGGDERRA